MDLNKFEKIEACNVLIEDLILLDFEMAFRLIRAEVKYDILQKSQNSIKEKDLEYFLGVLGMYIEQQSFYKKSQLVISNNKLFYIKFLQKILKQD